MQRTWPASSRAAVVRAFREPLQIEDVPTPDHVEPGALLAKIETCSICGTDIHLWQGSLSRKVDLPVIIGHEMVGRIVAMGDGADRDSAGSALRIGDRILWTHTQCGHCHFCTVAQQPMLCVNRRTYMHENIEQPPYLLGGFSQYGYVLPDSGRVKVPDAVSNAVASLSSCAFRSVINATDELGRIESSDTVLVQGAGPLGVLAVAVARVAGARKIIVIGGPASRLALAEAFGADHCIALDDTDAPQRVEAVHALTEGRGADVVMEFTGVPTAFNEGLELVRRGGRYLTVGQLGLGQTTFTPSTIVRKNLRILGALSGGARSYWKALQFVCDHQGRFPFERMISNHYTLDEVNTALERMKNLQETKPLLNIA